MGEKNKKWNKTAILFLVSYFIIMIVPLLISVVYYYPKMRTTLIENAAERSLNVVKQVDLLMDSQLNHVLGMPNHITTNKQIIEYDILNNQLAARTAQEQLGQMIKTNSFIEHLFLYMRDNQYLLSARTGTFYYGDIKVNPSLYQTSFGDISMDELQTHLDTAQETTVIYSKSVIVSGVRYNEALMFIMPIPQGKHAYGSVLACVPISNLKSLIPKDSYKSESRFIFLDHKGELVYTTGGLEAEDKAAISRITADISKDSGSGFVDLNGKKQLLTWSKSGKYGWMYINTVPLISITKDINRLQQPAIIITCLGTVLSLLLIFISMRINYSPIKRLANIASKSGYGGKSINDDFHIINQLIDELLSDNSRLGKIVNQTEPRLKEYLVSLIIRGQWSKLPDITYQAEQIDMDLSKNPFRVFLVNYENEQSAQDALARLNAHEPMGDMSVIVEHGEKDGQIIIIISGSMDMSDEQALLNILSSYRQLAIGTEAADIKGINNSYNNAISVMDYMELMKLENQALRYEDLPERMFKPRNYPIEVMQSLEMAIRYGDNERMHKIVDQIVAIISIDHNAPYFTRGVYLNTVNLLISGFSRSIGEDKREVLEIGTRLMMSHYTVTEMIDFIKTTADQLSRIIRGSQRPSGISNILQYIESRIGSPDLSLQSAADTFNMSASAFSRMFKDKAGRNFKEYVDSARISHAKKLLVETNLTIEQIAIEVGYETVTSFYRLFKKQAGLAPGEYRQTAAEKRV